MTIVHLPAIFLCHNYCYLGGGNDPFFSYE